MSILLLPLLLFGKTAFEQVQPYEMTESGHAMQEGVASATEDRERLCAWAHTASGLALRGVCFGPFTMPGQLGHPVRIGRKPISNRT